MRLDKFLQVSRLVKRRDLVRELAGDGRLDLNGRKAKPSKEVVPGDRITVRFWQRRLIVAVAAIPAGNVPRKEAHGLYEILEDRVADEADPDTET